MAPSKIQGQEVEDSCGPERQEYLFPTTMLICRVHDQDELKKLIFAALSSHFLAVAQAKLLLIQEESA